MDRKTKKLIKQIQAMSHDSQIKTVQAMQIEGVNFEVALDSLLDGQPITGIEGTENQFRNYSSQVIATYRKYNGEEKYGNDQVRLIVDSRVAFTSGEGVSVAYGDNVGNAHKELFELFIKENKLDGTQLFDINKTTEMSGYALIEILPPSRRRSSMIPRLGLYHTSGGKFYYRPRLLNPLDIESLQGFDKVEGGQATESLIDAEKVVYIRTGGYGCFLDEPTTKVGIVLKEAENYDRGLADMRENSYRCARITPDFETKTEKETKALSSALKAMRWKIGQARVGTAKFNYRTPSTGVHQSLQIEIATVLKTLSGVTSVPVHWLGWVDQMSNRATAQELYAMIYNGTIMERRALESGIKELFIKMQKAYIDMGGELITEVTDDFEIKLSLIDFGRFESMVKSYSMLYADDIISEETYRNIVPGINPEKEKQLIEKRNQEEIERGMNEDLVTRSDITQEEEEQEET